MNKLELSCNNEDLSRQVEKAVQVGIIMELTGNPSGEAMHDVARHIKAQRANLSAATNQQIANETLDWAQDFAAGIVRKLLGLPV